jgi:hypothetical protein
MPSIPTQRTLAKLRADGYTCAIVEKWNKWAKVRQDMGGFADIVAWKPGAGVLAIQTTSGSNVAARIQKIKESTAACAWLLSPAWLEVWGWRKAGERGKRKTWQLRRVWFDVGDDGEIRHRE